MTEESPSGSGGNRFPREARVTRSDDIRALFRRGKRRRTFSLDVLVSASPAVRSRIGFVVPKPRKRPGEPKTRIRAAAVRRNLLKRRLKEIARVELLSALPSGQGCLDILVRARPEAYDVGFEQLRSELLEVKEWLCSRRH
ncbi:MAG: ribonuclease P protein component [Gemmatimonadota bacterium]|jgi:ribonuclease P protein component|nr:ribonuclease P protein component [Gemmatimonadota bacterium]